MKARRAAARRRGNTRYEPARRLHEVKVWLNSGEGVTVYDMMERFSVTRQTAIRYLQALERAGEPLHDEMVGRRKTWRLMPTARRESIALTMGQMISLYLSRRVFDSLAGTGFKEDLDEVFAKVEATLKRRDFAATRDLDRKIFDVNEAAYIYDDRIEHVDAIVTALLREERLSVTHEGFSNPGKPFVFDPYTLLVYKKGLYLAGFSHHHGEIRILGLDAFTHVEWLKRNRFQYPKKYNPSELSAGSFGLIKGEPADVRIFFTDKVARFVRRRRWHPTQKVRKVKGGIVVRMFVGGPELVTWILGFEDQALVLAPRSLRKEIAGALARTLALYRRKPAAARTAG